MFAIILPNILLPRKGEFKKFSPAWGKSRSGAVLYLEEFNSEQLGSRADACAPCGFGSAESSLRCASVHSRSAQFVLLRV